MVGIRSILALVVTIACIVLYALYLELSRDIPAPITSDLDLPCRDISAEDNAFEIFKMAGDAFVQPTNCREIINYISGAPINTNVLVSLLAKNAKAFDLLKTGQDRSYCYVPREYIINETNLNFHGLVSVGRLLLVKSLYEEQAGHLTAATDDCIILLKGGNLIQKDSGPLINYLIGLSFIEKGLHCAEHLLKDKEMQLPDIMRLDRVLKNIAPFHTGLIGAYKVEYFSFVRSIDEFYGSITQGKPKLRGRHNYYGYVFQPNKTRLLMANYYRVAISNAPRDYCDIKIPRFAEELLLTRNNERWFRPNMLGSIVIDLYLFNIRSMGKKISRAKAFLEKLQVMGASRLYQNDHNGRLPENWQQLVPQYLSEVPMSPMDGKPLELKRVTSLFVQK